MTFARSHGLINAHRKTTAGVQQDPGGYFDVAGGIDQIHYIALQICNVIIRFRCRAVVINQAVGHPGVVVGEVQRFGCRSVGDRFPQELASRVNVLVRFRYGFFYFAAVEHRLLLGIILLSLGCRIVCGSPAVLVLPLREDEIYIKFWINLQQVADFYAIFFKNLPKFPLLLRFGEKEKLPTGFIPLHTCI